MLDRYVSAIISCVDISYRYYKGGTLSPGTLYPTLHRLEKDGYLESRSKVVGGKVRKYYTITERGLIALNEARQKIAELVNEVLLDK